MKPAPVSFKFFIRSLLAGLLIINILLPIYTAPRVYAEITQCGATSASPTYISPSSSGTFTFTLENNGPDDAAWVRITRPSDNFTITAGSKTGWSTSVSSNIITFTGGTFEAGTESNFEVSITSGSSEISAQSFTVSMNSVETDDGATSCSSSASIQITNTPPSTLELTNISVSNVSSSSVTITFDSGTSATSTVDYGTTDDYGSTSTVSTATTSHTHSLTGLSANTTYHYNITIIDASDSNSTDESGDTTFTTALSASATSTPGPTATPQIIRLTPTPAPDTKKPVVTIQKILSTPYKDLPTITGSVIDNDTLRSIEYSIDKGSKWNAIKGVTGLASGDATFSFIPTGLTTGTWQIWVRARDVTGNMSASAITTILVDQQGPTISLKNTLSQSYKDSPLIEGTSQDPSGESFIEWSFDSTYWQQVDQTTHTNGITNFIFQLPGLDDGNYTITIRATDSLGNQTQLVVPPLVIDRIPPRVGGRLLTVGPLILTPDSTNTITSLADITHKITLSLIGGPVQASILLRAQEANIPDQTFSLYKTKAQSLWSGEFTPSQPSGLYTVWIEALDGAGRKLSQPLFTLSLQPGSRIVDKASNPISGYVKLYTKDDDTGNFVPWNALQYGQTNPQTLKQGSFTFYLPEGTYYLEIENKETGERLISTIITHTSTSPFIYTFIAPEKRFSLLNSLRFLPRRQALTRPYQIDNNTINSYTSTSKIPETYPSTILRNGTEELSSTTIKGKTTTLVFINSWSPHANSFIAQYKTEENVVMVFPHESQEQVYSFISRGQYEGSFIADPDGELLEHFSYVSIPSVYTVLPNLQITQ